jgi:hypothetical protein
LEEIKSINSTLIDTVISMSGDCGTDGISSYGGAMIKLSYSAVSISPIMKSLFATSEMVLWLSEFRYFLHFTAHPWLAQ